MSQQRDGGDLPAPGPEPVPLESLLLPEEPAGAAGDPVPLETLLLPSDGAGDASADADPPEFAGVSLPPPPQSASLPPPRAAAPAVPPPARRAPRSASAPSPVPPPARTASSPRWGVVAGGVALAAIAGTLAYGGFLRPGGAEVAAAPAPAPATTAAATPASASASAPAAKAAPAPADEDRLRGGRTAAWWRERLALLSGRTDPESVRLHALTLQRATRLGISGLAAAADRSAATASAPTLPAAAP